MGGQTGLALSPLRGENDTLVTCMRAKGVRLVILSETDIKYDICCRITFMRLVRFGLLVSFQINYAFFLLLQVSLNFSLNYSQVHFS